MKRINKLLIIMFMLLFAITEVFASGGNRTGTGGAAQLLIPVGARGIAMGGSNIAAISGVDALYWNPAGVARMNSSFDAMFSHMNYIADIGVEYGAISAKLEGLGVFSLSIKSISVDEIAITTTQNPDGTGATYKPSFITAGISFSKALTDNIAIGVTGNLVSETLGDVSASGFALDIGVLYNNLASVNGLSFGVAIKNLGPQMQFEGSGLVYQLDSDNLNRPPGLYRAEAAPFELPSRFEIGFSYVPTFDEYNEVVLAGNYINNNFSSDEYKVGAEYGYNNRFFVRGGYVFAPQADDENFIYGFTAGAGISYPVSGLDLKIDYAYRDVEYFDANHIFQVGIGF
ncbi:MAG: PorV/PorQ family protein [Ignavibacteriae bacterium]|nr:hypothetical protein [Ignavibacteriota bacterium]NOG99926.1 PorV/PorQ family protein [Ignavibacteriota bacterium]